MFSSSWKTVFLLPLSLAALPQGADVIAGHARMNIENESMRIDAMDSSIIEWNSFCIGQNEKTTFTLPDSQSAILNRVIGGEISSIFGRLDSNGQVFLINPQGILIGKEGVIEAAGFIGSSLNLSNENFLAKGPLLFDGSDSSLVNEGTITATDGNLFLVGAELVNHGNLQALKGMAALCEGDSVYIHLSKNEPIWIKIQSNESRTLVNEGIVRGANVQLHGPSISHSGMLDATSAVEREGRVYLVADQSIDFEGEVLSPGGEVRVLGDSIRIKPDARIETSGERGGGIVLIGGDEQGDNPRIPNARFTFVEEGAEIRSNAIQSGHGGKVVVWADDTTVFQGHISAQALGQIGDGGFAEISGASHLFISGLADLQAKNGKFGTVYCDPGSVLIQSGANVAPPVTLDTFNDGYIAAQLALGNLTIDTVNSTNGGTETMTINNDVAVSWATTNTLTLIAGREIVFNGGGAGATFDNTGAGSMVLTAQGLGAAATFVGVDLNNAQLSSGGSIIVTGLGGSIGSDNYGINVQGGTVLTATGIGTITLNGTGGAGTTANHGINFNTANPFVSAGGAVSATGFAGNGSGAGNFGVNLTSTMTNVNSLLTITGTGGGTDTTERGITMSGFTLNSTGSGNVIFMGTAASGTNSCEGINFNGATTVTASSTGTLSFTGIGNGSGDNNYGININRMSLTTATSSVNFTGTGGNGTNSNAGIFLQPAVKQSISFSTTDGDITLTGSGRGAGSSNHGINSNASGRTVTYISSGTGKLSFIGFGSNTGTDNAAGVNFNSGANTLTGNNGDIIFQGTGGAGAGPGNRGVAISGTGASTSGTGNISITGIGGANGTSDADGVHIISSTTLSTSSTGDISLTGTAGGTTGTNPGITLFGSISIPGSGSLLLNGTGGGMTGTDNLGIRGAAPAAFSTTTGNISMIGMGGPGTDSNSGIRLEGSVTTTSLSGNITMTGTGNGSGSLNRGLDLNANCVTAGSGIISLTGIASSLATLGNNEGVFFSAPINVQTADGNLTINGTASSSPLSGAGVYLSRSLGAASIQTTGLGSISITGSGSATGTDGILVDGTIQTMGTGNISLQSNQNDVEIAATSVLLQSGTGGSLSILAVTGASNIILDQSVTSGGAFIAAANNDFTLQATGLLTITGDGSIIVDQQMPNGLGAGFFSNLGTIISMSGNLAIYAVSGPNDGGALSPSPPLQVVLGNLNPPIADWDAALAPQFLLTKYATSWNLGGVSNGRPGFGSVYTPGTGNFGSQVVWYKFPLSPQPLIAAEEHISATPYVFQQLWVNAQVLPEYFYYPYEFCRGFPCMWIEERMEWSSPCIP